MMECNLQYLSSNIHFIATSTLTFISTIYPLDTKFWWVWVVQLSDWCCWLCIWRHGFPPQLERIWSLLWDYVVCLLFHLLHRQIIWGNVFMINLELSSVALVTISLYLPFFFFFLFSFFFLWIEGFVRVDPRFYCKKHIFKTYIEGLL